MKWKKIIVYGNTDERDWWYFWVNMQDQIDWHEKKWLQVKNDSDQNCELNLNNVFHIVWLNEEKED